MSGNIQAGVAGKVLPVLSTKKMAVQEFIKRFKNSVFESAGVCEIRVRLYLWEMSGKTRRKVAGHILNSAITGKMAFLVVTSLLFFAGGILMAWQSRNGLAQGVQTANTAAFEPFHRPSHPATGFIGRPRQAGFDGYEPPRGERAIAPARSEMPRRNFPAKSAIKEHARIVFRPSERTSQN